jgi:transcriptional regulator with XRE-family HTH domain
MDGLRQMPEYAAEGLALDFIGACEVRRAELGLSYAELARRMGVSRAYISKLMGGTQMSSVGSLVKLARALGCDLHLALMLPSAASKHSSKPVREATRPLALVNPKVSAQSGAPRGRASKPR